VTSARTVSEDDLARLKRDRHAADQRYNEALTALDAAVQALPALPHPPPPPDEHQITPLNEGWRVADALPAAPGGWRGRLAGFVLALLRPALDRQQAFNAALVDHVNRNLPRDRAVPEAIAAAIESLRQQMELVIRFQSRLVVFLQQVTPFVDTKDLEFHALSTRITEDVAEAHEQLARTVRGVAAALSGVSDDVLKRWERYEGLRTSVATMQLAVQALRRESTEASTRLRGDGGQARAPAEATAGKPELLSSDRLTSHKYVAFENLFRGDPKVIRERMVDYLPLFARSQDVLDVGCGRGEFLELLKDNGIRARGIDFNHEMVAGCRASGLDAIEADALSYLRSQPDEALGGLIAAQVVEHLEPDYLIAFLDEAFRTLRRGSAIVLETINVASWSAFFSSYLRDLTHVKPVHSETLKFLALAAGFVDADIRLRAPLDEGNRLVRSPNAVRRIDLRTTSVEGRAVTELADAFDRNVERLNAQLYAPLDYALIAWKR
jgi:O-antigen chain-terminating methyltransferase